MGLEETLFVCGAFLAISLLYSSVGQAGASGYLAVLALGTTAPELMRPIALSINVLVSAVSVYRLRRAKLFSWNALWPFLAGSLPLAALGGATSLPRAAYFGTVGVVLVAAALYLAWQALRGTIASRQDEMRVDRIPAAFAGAAIGLLSGLTGIGGGILLSPMLLFLGWAGARTAAGISAPFILANSLVALAAGLFTVQEFPAELPLFAASAIAGTLAGTWLGIEKLSPKALLLVLALLMALAGARLLLAA